ncbi:hypothetical protein NOF55_06960 [Rhizobiaceae bacterium BDR2-2]|uniref:Uncharacterized protein n=1 Tax=Ectorhizobium quercum TaxID=2965071 RepID=A0AAE3N018_9HYPH|nr:hypothetical protein [Ectorhizobium quercum]
MHPRTKQLVVMWIATIIFSAIMFFLAMLPALYELYPEYFPF